MMELLWFASDGTVGLLRMPGAVGKTALYRASFEETGQVVFADGLFGARQGLCNFGQSPPGAGTEQQQRLGLLLGRQPRTRPLESSGALSGAALVHQSAVSFRQGQYSWRS